MINKIWKKAKYLVVPVIIIVLCFVLYYLLDYFSNGVILDWLDKNFTYETFRYNDDGTQTYIHNISWSVVKSYMLNFFIVLLIIISLIVMRAKKHISRKITIETSHNIAEYISRYILNNDPLPVEIPQECAEVFARISEVKAKIRQNEKSLLDESERKNDLVTYLAHDLKTPLTSVIGYLTLLNDEDELSQTQQRKYISVALNKAERLEDLTNELFDITRFNISNIELQKEKVDLSKMLEQIVYEFNPLLLDKELSFELSIEKNIQIVCDVDKTQRVIDNLIRNAISYSYKNSKIKISLLERDTDIVLCFRNSGKTIPDEKLSRIFEQFYRINSSRESSTGGAGLGLAIAKQLVEASGGTITAESENEIICFTVTLPKK